MKSLEDLQKTLDTLVTETSASYEDDDDYVTVKTIVDRTRAKKDIAVLAINLYDAVVKSHAAITSILKERIKERNANNRKDQELQDCKTQIEEYKKAKENEDVSLSTIVENNAKAIEHLTELVQNRPSSSSPNELVSYREVAGRNVSKKGVVLVPSIRERKPDIANRVRVIIKPKDVNISSSKEIRKEFNRKYSQIVIENCYSTAGGSIYMELEDEEAAKWLDSNWDEELFGGNEGFRVAEDDSCIGIIKNVIDFDSLSPSQLEDKVRRSESIAIKTNSKIECFQRKNRAGKEEFTGTIKVIFKDRASLLDAVKDKVSIDQHRYSVEEWVYRPKVRHCYRCLRFGHVAHRCRSTTMKCGKCGKTEHETKDCNITNPKKFKCQHCGENHVTGSYSCSKMKEELEKLINRL